MIGRMLIKLFSGGQDQAAGDNSINVQAGRDIIVGVSAAEARQIALDVYRANALELAGVAQEIARQRVEHLTDRLMEELQAKLPQGIQQAANPDFQHAVFEAQKAYARSGDESLEGVLVSLLSDRAAEPEQNLRQVVLNEAVTTVGKLTAQQIDVLTVIFYLRHTKNNGLGNYQQLREYFDPILLMAESIPESNSIYTYLAYAGATTVEISEIQLGEILRKSYPGLLCKGFEPAVFAPMLAREPAAGRLVGQCLANSALLQVTVLDRATVQEKALEMGLSEQSTNELCGHLESNLLNDAEIKELVFQGDPRLERLFRLWDATPLRQSVVTPVGMAIAHSNAIRRERPIAPLEVWVN